MALTDDRAVALVAELEQELRQLDEALDRGVGGDAAEALKARIVALFRRVDGLVADLAATRERIRELAVRYQTLAGPVRTDQEGAASPSRRLRADHLGASTYVEKGWTLIARGDHAGAIEALTRALELAPTATEAKALLGWAQMLGEQYDQALATLSEVLAEEPANALARVNVGFICLKKRIFGEAIEHLARAIRLDSDRKATLYAHYYLGLVYLEREMFADAQTFLTRALALGPNLIEACYDLGRAQWLAGDHEAARATWRKGAGANRFNPWSLRCQELLDAVDRGAPVPRSSSAA